MHFSHPHKKGLIEGQRNKKTDYNNVLTDS